MLAHAPLCTLLSSTAATARARRCFVEVLAAGNVRAGEARHIAAQVQQAVRGPLGAQPVFPSQVSARSAQPPGAAWRFLRSSLSPSRLCASGFLCLLLSTTRAGACARAWACVRVCEPRSGARVPHGAAAGRRAHAARGARARPRQRQLGRQRALPGGERRARAGLRVPRRGAARWPRSGPVRALGRSAWVRTGATLCRWARMTRARCGRARHLAAALMMPRRWCRDDPGLVTQTASFARCPGANRLRARPHAALAAQVSPDDEGPSRCCCCATWPRHVH